MPCSIGVHEHERHATQRVRINLRVQVAEDERPIGDSIANVVSYEAIVDGIRAIARSGHINLVETLADRIVELCLANQRVRAVCGCGSRSSTSSRMPQASASRSNGAASVLFLRFA